MTSDNGHPTVELALADLSRKLEVGLTEIRGQLALLIQQAKQAERRADDQARELRRHDERLDALEHNAVTRADMDRSRTRVMQVLGLLATVLGIASGAGTSVIIAIVN